MDLRKIPAIAIVALVLVGVSLSVVTAGLLAQQSLTSSGTVGDNVVSSVNVDIYADAAATVPCSSIDWGNLSPGSSVSRTVYVKNTGNVSETLSMSASGWNPASADSVLTLGWNKEGTTLAASAVVPATFTLTVAKDTGDLTSFSFSIVVTGSA